MPSPDGFHGGRIGLEELLQTDWPRGTALTRTQLEAARSENPPGE
jgi:hypothetical protein